MKKITWLFLIITLPGLPALAQDQCGQTLVAAERAYYAGQLREVESLLHDCLATGFSNDQKAAAYRILALSYLFSRRSSAADSVIQLLFDTDPQYRAGPVDPPEFRKRLEKFNVFPRWALHFNAGGYRPFFNVGQVYNLRNVPADISYRGHTGWQLGPALSYYINKKVLIETSYEWQSFSFTVDKNDLNYTNNPVETTMDETQRRTQFTLMTGYNYLTKSISLQVLAGLAYNTLVSANRTLYRQEHFPDTNQGQYWQSNQFSVMDQRSKHDYRPVLLVRVGLPQKNNYVINIFGRYEYGIQNFATNREGNTARMIQYEWIENDFKASFFYFGLSITKLMYHVQKSAK